MTGLQGFPGHESSLHLGAGLLTNRFHVAVRLFNDRSQMTSKCGKNKKVAHEAQPSVSLMFLPHFWLLCLAKNCDWFKVKIQKIQNKYELSAVIIYASVL